MAEPHENLPTGAVSEGPDGVPIEYASPNRRAHVRWWWTAFEWWAIAYAVLAVVIGIPVSIGTIIYAMDNYDPGVMLSVGALFTWFFDHPVWHPLVTLAAFAAPFGYHRRYRDKGGRAILLTCGIAMLIAAELEFGSAIHATGYAWQYIIPDSVYGLKHNMLFHAAVKALALVIPGIAACYAAVKMPATVRST